MDSSPWRIGAALLCAAIVGACQKTETPSTAGATGGSGPVGPRNDWPIQDLVLVTDNHTRTQPEYLFRVHMDVPVSTISQNLETSVEAQDGAGILKEILGDLLGGTLKPTTSSWATLKAALGCDDLSAGNATCVAPGTPASPGADLFLVKDFSKDPTKKYPVNILRVQMDFKLKSKATRDKIEADLNAHTQKNLLVHLRSDASVDAASKKSVKRSLKAALECANVDEDITSCQ